MIDQPLGDPLLDWQKTYGQIHYNWGPELLQTYPVNLDYRNVSLVSRKISSIVSRDEIDTSTEFCGVKLDVPIVAPPMVDVCNGPVALKIRQYGGFAFLHRFCTIEEQVEQFKLSDRTAGCALGLVDWMDRFKKLYVAGCRVFCIDVANGACETVKKIAKEIKDKYFDVKLLTGNICSREGFEFLYYYSDAIRLNVGSGHACRTTNVTGIYHPSLSLIDECKLAAERLYNYEDAKSHNKIVSDGGINEPGDMCKSLIWGSSCVMIGSQIAACKDSPAQRTSLGLKIYHGSASYENQLLYKETPKYIEGTTRYLECKETIEELFSRYKEGLKSSMSYFNARNLTEYRANLDYVVL